MGEKKHSTPINLPQVEHFRSSSDLYSPDIVVVDPPHSIAVAPPKTVVAPDNYFGNFQSRVFSVVVRVKSVQDSTVVAVGSHTVVTRHLDFEYRFDLLESVK